MKLPAADQIMYNWMYIISVAGQLRLDCFFLFAGDHESMGNYDAVFDGIQ
jgi:hypothetical protein